MACAPCVVDAPFARVVAVPGRRRRAGRRRRVRVDAVLTGARL